MTDDEILRGAPAGLSTAHLDRAALEAGLAALPRPPRNAGRLELLVARAFDQERRLLDRARLDPMCPLPGDRWRPGEKGDGNQLTVMRADVGRLIANGQDLTLFGDNLLVDLDLSEANLSPGALLLIGTAALEVTDEPHTGCKKYRQRFGLDALRLTADHRAQRLRGLHVRVVERGSVAVGDTIEVIRPRTTPGG